ncbi:unnamed protein product [Zymoseptoria tritici ST99CH_1A5]|uniref:Uncharacterized protein n=1 Tax=Zymoseptoria tritici ST99CH_1A5 TaxID=1276529 RepID=A0A1Y6M3G4_ZYMTR|nr:unnamed protein product [Zymoseptoria tritici ST99CH_1A5]
MSPSPAVLDTQRRLISRYQHLHDVSQLLHDQRDDTSRLLSQLSSRKAALLASRRSRQEYLTGYTLVEVSRILNVEGWEKMLEGSNRRLADKLKELGEEMEQYTLDKRTGYLHLHHQPETRGSAKRWRLWKVLMIRSMPFLLFLLLLLFVLVLALCEIIY